MAHPQIENVLLQRRLQMKPFNNIRASKWVAVLMQAQVSILDKEVPSIIEALVLLMAMQMLHIITDKEDSIWVEDELKLYDCGLVFP